MSSPVPLVVRLMAEQRKRCLATILGAAEASPWWAKLTEAQQNTYREQVRTALAVFYDLARDVIKVSDDDAGGMRSDLALELIRSVHSQQLRLSEQLTRDARDQHVQAGA